MLPFAIIVLRSFVNEFAFLYVEANSKDICEEITFPSFFRKILISAILLWFKANDLEKNAWLPNFSLWTPITVPKVYIFRVTLTWHEIFVFSRQIPKCQIFLSFHIPQL